MLGITHFNPECLVSRLPTSRSAGPDATCWCPVQFFWTQLVLTSRPNVSKHHSNAPFIKIPTTSDWLPRCHASRQVAWHFAGSLYFNYGGTDLVCNTGGLLTDRRTKTSGLLTAVSLVGANRNTRTPTGCSWIKLVVTVEN